jgi:hypothetical protein
MNNMNSKIYFVLILALASFGCAQQQNESLSDLIEIVNLKAETTTKVVISDLFYAKNYDCEFLHNDYFDVAVNKEEGTLKITPYKNFSGLDLISFNFNNETFELPVKLVRRNKYLFKYKPEGDPQVVNLFGQFNSWNRQSLPMADNDGDGEYEISIPLDPGRYEYKIFVDGVELADPNNFN